jgi:alkylation response protein AidB-like acyl-CoA dehydrogenase
VASVEQDSHPEVVLDQFRDEVRQWFSTVRRPFGLRDYGATPTESDLEAGRAWQRLLAEAGWACIAWPSTWGGRGASAAEQAVFAEECAQAGVPRQLNIVGPDLVGPVLLAHGSDPQRQTWLPRIRSGDDLWCQLFSEPDAGSDVAGIATRARRAGQGWVVNGRKVWSSGARSADLGLLLVRTGTDRYDLSMFALPMRTSGVEVRPIRQMDGESKFNEVTFDDVEVDDRCLLGSPGDGWKLAMSTLGSERQTLGAQAVALAAHLDDTTRIRPPVGGPARQEYAALWTRIFLLRLNFRRLLGAGRPLGDPLFSTLKLEATELQRDLCRYGVGQAGPAAMSWSGAPPTGTARFLAQPGQTIAGGTSEIQRNIVAERVLGLPREKTT